MSQTWPLSQDANKASGSCSVCHATRQLHHRDGTVHRHGPRDRPCPGSNRPPLNALSQPAGASRPRVDNSPDLPSAAMPNCQSPFWTPPEHALIKHIPKSARPACATHLTSILHSVVSDPSSITNWRSLLCWGGTVLCPPKRAGRRHNLCTELKRRISSYSSGPSASCHPSARHPKSQISLSQAIASKLEDGNVRAAVRLLTSQESPATPSAETLASLRDKHPTSSGKLDELPSPSCDNSLVTDEAEVRRAILSFPAGSAGGPDGLRPQHIRDLVLCRESGPQLLSALTGFVNMIFSGKCPPEVASVFFGGRLLALNKKSGGIRPIVVGFTLRRLASKCANSVGIGRLKSYFQPHQLGVGSSGGCEAAIHAARRYLESLPPDHIVVKLDFANAFNTLHRYDMLQAIHDRLPDLYPYCFSAYSQSAFLYYGNDIILSQEGTQQGDPLGPLLFSNTIQPLLHRLSSNLQLGYLDDLTLGGPIDSVCRDVAEIREAGAEMGLVLNPVKCELISHRDDAVSDQFVQSFSKVDIGDATLLGAPLFPGPVLDKTWSDRCDDLARAVDRLATLGSQDALILLRSSFSAPKVLHLLRCSPSVSHPSLDRFDSLLRSAIERITNSDLSDTQWLQASLPVRDGGLGVRRVASLALPAFVASAASTLPLQDAILMNCACSNNSAFQNYLSLWSSAFGPLPEDLPPKQPFWDRPGVLADRALVESQMNSPLQQASFLAASSSHSGDWLFALPIASCGLRLDDEAVRVAVGIRLGLPICVPHQCQCGELVDAYGIHSFVCKRASGRTARHHALNELVARAFGSAGIPVTKEPNGLSRSDGKRPDGLSLIPWQEGKPLCWDVTVICPLANSYLQSATASAGAVAELAATRKVAKYSILEDQYIFQPIAVESLGPMNWEARKFLADLGRKISRVSGDDRETTFLFQRISVLLFRFNSVLLHNSFELDDRSEH